MLEIPRRTLLQGAAAASALAALDVRSTLAQAAKPSKLTDIDHIIILMKENRSFDHYFGTLSGVRGFDDPGAVRRDGSSIFRQPDPASDAGYALPFHLDTEKTTAQRLHELSHASGQPRRAGCGPNHLPKAGVRGQLGDIGCRHPCLPLPARRTCCSRSRCPAPVSQTGPVCPSHSLLRESRAIGFPRDRGRPGGVLAPESPIGSRRRRSCVVFGLASRARHARMFRSNDVLADTGSGGLKAWNLL